MAVLRGFVTDWQPRGSIETALLETLAQAYTAQLIWTTRLQALTLAEAKCQDRDLERQGQWEPPTVDAAAAIDQAAAMVDRFNRLFARTLRALRDLRRYTPQIVVQKVDQLNVGAQQVNMAPQAPTQSMAEPDTEERKALKSTRRRRARRQTGGDATQVATPAT
jgi:hypothetical protein